MNSLKTKSEPSPTQMSETGGTPVLQVDDSLATLKIRIHGGPDRPTLIYLPGIHGDWTLVTEFRTAIQGLVRFVEFSYPRTLTWSLDEYAAAIEQALLANHIPRGWLLGESFGSQIVWALLARAQARPGVEPFRPQGMILAGGFVRYPLYWGVRMAQAFTAQAPGWCQSSCFCLFAQYAKQRHRRTPEALAGVQEFIRRRREPMDRQAIGHRLKLIAEHDPRPIARQTRLPVYSLAGLVDPIVPLLWVRRWLERHCPGYRGGKTILLADHNVLGTAPRVSAEQVWRWMGQSDAALLASPSARLEA